jgi:glycosyltransferase involved in cell wall biosynthesis
MALKLSIFTTATNPTGRGDNAVDAIRCYRDLADEVVFVNGGDTELFEWIINGDAERDKSVMYRWPTEFSWPFIGEQFQRGYEACTGDWVIHCDLDFIFHQKDFGKIRQALRDYPSSPAVSFYKHQYVQPHKYNLKSRLPLALNKKAFGDRIKFNGGGDLTQPTIDGNELDLNEIPQAGVAFWNYEHLLKTEEQIKDDIGRMDRAYHRHFGEWLYSNDGTEESAYQGWWRMIEGRYAKPQESVKLEQHPKYIIDTIKNLKPNQFGYNGFGRLGGGYHA